MVVRASNKYEHVWKPLVQELLAVFQCWYRRVRSISSFKRHDTGDWLKWKVTCVERLSVSFKGRVIFCTSVCLHNEQHMLLHLKTQHVLTALPWRHLSHMCWMFALAKRRACRGCQGEPKQILFCPLYWRCTAFIISGLVLASLVDNCLILSRQRAILCQWT